MTSRLSGRQLVPLLALLIAGSVPVFAESPAEAVRNAKKKTHAVHDPSAAVVTGTGSNGAVFESAPGFGVVQSGDAEASSRARSDQQLNAAEAGLKIYVTREGWHRVTRTSMAAAGFDPGSDAGSLALFTAGIEQPIAIEDGGDGRLDAGDAVEFYGYPADRISTGARTYWLRHGKGKGSRLKPAAASSTGTHTGTVPFTVERVEKIYFIAPLITNGEQENFFGTAIFSDPSTQPLTVRGADVMSFGNARLEVVVQGLTEDVRAIHFRINGHGLGTRVVSGMEQKTLQFDVPHFWLVNGTNQLSAQSLIGWWDASVIVSTRLIYDHVLRADEGAFEALLQGGVTTTIRGFPAGRVRALDVTDPQRPAELRTSSGPDGSGGFVISVTPAGSGQRAVLVVHESRTQTPAEMVANLPSRWSDEKKGADLLIITHAAFTAAASALRNLREQEGLTGFVVDVEDLYDEFDFGTRGPAAIKSFLRAATSWKKAPRYVVLLGDASLDPRNYQELGSFDYVPTKLVVTEFMKTASDDWFADLDGNGYADIAVGRIPVRTTAEANRIVARLSSRGTPSGDWATRALFVSDGPYDYDFMSMIAALEPLLPAGFTSSTVNAGATATPNADVTAAFNQGHLIVNYVGHASIETWGLHPFYNGASASAQTNGNRLPFVVAMNCLNGFFHDTWADSLAEAFLKGENGGAIAVWASSSLTFPFGQMNMNQELLRLISADPSIRIGDACRRAKLGVSDADVRNSWILFGDPSMKLR